MECSVYFYEKCQAENPPEDFAGCPIRDMLLRDIHSEESRGSFLKKTRQVTRGGACPYADPLVESFEGPNETPE